MINIREHTRNDIKYRLKWLNNKKATIYAVDDPGRFVTPDSQKRWFDEYEKDESKKFYTIEDNESPIGFMGLSNIDKNQKSANCFILIGEDNFRGKGYGREAMIFLINYSWSIGLERINLEVSKKNISAIKLYRGLGFVEVEKINEEIKMSLHKK